VRDEIGVAEEAAREAGGLLMRWFERPIEVSMKSGRELVTEMDKQSESLIMETIRSEYPGDRFIAEESAPSGKGRSQEGAGRVWIVDPLDGTNNYAHGYPFFSIAIALEENGVLVAGVVYDPLRDELFAAERGAGALLNGEPCRISETESLSESIVATGFPYDRSEMSDNNLANLNRFILSVRGIRRGGSAELDLAYVACGRLEGFWELGLKTWDVSAGGLVVLEAGGRVTNFEGRGWDHRRGDVVASNGLVHEEMLRLIA
jgi:myo-inositol-1(or 4)-monophosphatase